MSGELDQIFDKGGITYNKDAAEAIRKQNA